jgi:hypothetical protein
MNRHSENNDTSRVPFNADHYRKRSAYCVGESSVLLLNTYELGYLLDMPPITNTSCTDGERRPRESEDMTIIHVNRTNHHTGIPTLTRTSSRWIWRILWTDWSRNSQSLRRISNSRSDRRRNPSGNG